MPTENRSRNTEMVSDKLPPCADDVFKNGVSACLVGDVPKHAAEKICQSLSAVTGWKIDWHYFGGRTHIKALAPAPQLQAEPIAWLVGSAIWWSKPEAEVDAGLVGEPVIPIGPLADAGDVERLRKVTAFVQRLVDCTGAQESVATGYLRDILDELKGSATPATPVECAICRDLGNQCMECEEADFREWAERHFAKVDYRKTSAGVFIQDWMRHSYAAWCARGALTHKS